MAGQKGLVNRGTGNTDAAENVTGTGQPLWSEIFTKFIPEDDVISNDRERVSQGMWSNNVGILTSFFTSSTAATATASLYYLHVYNYNINVTSSAEVQFDIAFGNIYGSGSTQSSTYNNDTPTRAIYSQMRNLLLAPGDNTFTIGSNTANSIFVVAFKRGRMKEKVDPGNWQLNLGASQMQLIDDSGANLDARVSSAGRIFNIVSGSVATGVVTAQTGSVYGLCYPDLGLLVFNAMMLNSAGVTSLDTGSTATVNNNFAFYNAIKTGSYFAARNEEEITSTHYFVRVKNKSYNFTNNPTFVTGSYGQIKHPDFIGDPKVYITTIGLYNDEKELLAVAKMSQPLLKSFSNEALIKVRLDY